MKAARDILVGAIEEQQPIVLVLGQDAWTESENSNFAMFGAMRRVLSYSKAFAWLVASFPFGRRYRVGASRQQAQLTGRAPDTAPPVTEPRGVAVKPARCLREARAVAPTDCSAGALQERTLGGPTAALQFILYPVPS